MGHPAEPCGCDVHSVGGRLVASIRFCKLHSSAQSMLEVLETIENDGKQVPAWLWERIQDVVVKAGGKAKV